MISILGIIIWLILCFLIGWIGSKRNIGSISAFLVSVFISPLFGILVVSLSGMTNTIINKWKAYSNVAEKAELKGEYQNAIDNYMDAIFHLENDYKNLNRSDESNRSGKLIILKNKVEKLRLFIEANN